jgi:hypothetical protein
MVYSMPQRGCGFRDQIPALCEALILFRFVTIGDITSA